MKIKVEYTNVKYSDPAVVTIERDEDGEVDKNINDNLRNAVVEADKLIFVGINPQDVIGQISFVKAVNVEVDYNAEYGNSLKLSGLPHIYEIAIRIRDSCNSLKSDDTFSIDLSEIAPAKISIKSDVLNNKIIMPKGYDVSSLALFGDEVKYFIDIPENTYIHFMINREKVVNDISERVLRTPKDLLGDTRKPLDDRSKYASDYIEIDVSDLNKSAPDFSHVTRKMTTRINLDENPNDSAIKAIDDVLNVTIKCEIFGEYEYIDELISNVNASCRDIVIAINGPKNGKDNLDLSKFLRFSKTCQIVPLYENITVLLPPDNNVYTDFVKISG